MKQTSYRGPYMVLGSEEDPIKPKLVLHGFVELRDNDGQVLAILQAGSMLGVESVLGNGRHRHYTYVAANDPLLDVYDDESKQASEVVAETINQILQWSRINCMSVEDRIEEVLSVLASGGELLITITDLARICGVTRVWASRVITALEEQSRLTRTGLWFSAGRGQ